MKMTLLLTALFALGLVITVCAGESEELKARFRERLPVIIAIKDEGIVGENNKGFLEFVGKTKKSEEVVKAENEDRLKLYQIIAGGTTVSVEVVGQRRALQIAREAGPGHMIQDERGKWAKAP